MMDVPRSKQFDDVYFSVQDGLAETRHVFLEGNDLPYAWAGKEHFTICETGFGTGLNFLAALQLLEAGERPKHLHYISFEKYPLDRRGIAQSLACFEALKSALKPLLANYPVDLNYNKYEIDISSAVRLTLIIGDVNEEMPALGAEVDCWFLDGFKPSTNPDMWSETVFQNMARLSAPNATFATFTAAGFVRRGLAAVGFDVRKVPGYGRKREMLVGQLCGS